MDSTTRQIIETCARDSHAGTASFGAIVVALAQAGVESYFADYRGGVTTYYLPSGESLAIPLATPSTERPDTFDAAGVLAAIRGAQRGDVKYPEFLHRSIAAGCVGYIVWIAGRHVTYFGRRGETHVERFPD